MKPFDFQKFVSRTRLKQREIAEKAGVSLGLVGMWASGKAKPSFETILKLIDCGITAEELFGDECAEKLTKNSGLTENSLSKADFIAGVREAMAEIAKLKQAFDFFDNKLQGYFFWDASFFRLGRLRKYTTRLFSYHLQKKAGLRLP